LREIPSTRGRIGVLIADDHAMFRQGVKEMLRTDEDIEVIGEAENGKEAVELAERMRPDVVLLDVEMPLMGARDAMARKVGLASNARLAKLGRRAPSVRVVAELVVEAVRPLELAEGEDQRHQRVLEYRARHAALPVAPVGDEDLLLHDAEAPAPR